MFEGISMKTRKVLLYTGGIITALSAVLHLTFWAQNNWGEELTRLNPDSKGIILALWIGTIYVLLFAAAISFYIGRKKEIGTLDKIVCVNIAGFFVVRIIAGIPLMGFSIQELFIETLCAGVVFCYLFPLRTAAKRSA
jgi:hypothetical protein